MCTFLANLELTLNSLMLVDNIKNEQLQDDHGSEKRTEGRKRPPQRN